MIHVEKNVFYAAGIFYREFFDKLMRDHFTTINALGGIFHAKRLAGFLLILFTVLTLLPTAVFAADTATPSDTKFVINGKSVSVSAAYVINNTNYLQLRAIVAMLNGTSAQFDVSWDGQYAVIEPGKPYSGTVTETKLKTTTDIRKSDTKTKAVSTPYIWNIYYENNAGNMDWNMYSLRPSTNTALALTVSGTVKEGTPVILSTQKNMDAPKIAEFTFLMDKPPQSVSFTIKGSELEDDGVYTIMPAESPYYNIDVNGESKSDGSKGLVVSVSGGKMEGGTNIILWTSDTSQSFVLLKGI